MEWLLTLTVCWHLAAVLLYTSDCLPAKLVIYLSQKNNVFESWSSVQCWPSVVLQKKNYPTVLQIIWAICKYYPFCGMCMGSKSPRKLSLRGKWSGIGFLGFPRLYGFWACCLQYRRHLGTEADLDKTASRPRSPWVTVWQRNNLPHIRCSTAATYVTNNCVCVSSPNEPQLRNECLRALT